MRPLHGILPLILLCAPLAEGKGKAKPAPPPPPPPAKPIPVELQNSVCVIENDTRNLGTGFIATFKGKTLLVTNQHVVFGEKTLKIRNSKGTEFKPAGGSVASGADIAFLSLAEPLPEGIKPFVLSENVAGIAKEGDEITIVGNSLGGGTLTSTGGKLKFLGPTRLEHDAPTVSGNSGSPIYHHSSGQVLGVDTESESVEGRTTVLDKATAKDARAVVKDGGVRIYGHRADTEKSWMNLDWKAINSVEDQLDRIYALLEDSTVVIWDGKPSLIKDDIMRKQFEEAELKFQNRSASDIEAYNLYMKALDNARTSIEFKIRQLEPSVKTHHHRERLRLLKNAAGGICRSLDIIKSDAALMRSMYAGKYKMPNAVRAILYADGTVRLRY